MESPQRPDIALWNRTFESDPDAPLPSSVWDEWIWESDLHERLTPTMMLHRGHLLGILIARYRARHYPEAMRLRLSQLYPTIVHGHVMVEDLSLRQLRDTAEDVQMHWPLYTRDWEAASQVVDAVTARLGYLLNLPPSIAARSPLLADDPASLDPEHPGRLSVPALRRFTSLLCILYRHLSLASLAADEADDPELAPAPHPGVENHHLQAGMDDFYCHSMLADLPPAARIIYKQDFQGMYHCVTQVVFMHFPNYERRRQLSLEELQANDAPPFHALSLLAQLQPDARIVYEDEALNPNGWSWVLLSGGVVYIVDSTRARVYTSRSLWALMQKCSSTNE
jgi:hypothetical protein